GVMLDATIHDAVLVEDLAGGIEDAVDQSRRAMDKASELVLSGFRLRTDVEVIRWPDRYRDARGAAFFDELMKKLDERCRSYRPAKDLSYWRRKLPTTGGRSAPTAGGRNFLPPVAPPPILCLIVFCLVFRNRDGPRGFPCQTTTRSTPTAGR